ncbi:MAG: hypothetical protein JO372_10585 [Solirubrobacterales bacterium]|nr:hypothetical protein [Solirubrobacterales bacterium]
MIHLDNDPLEPPQNSTGIFNGRCTFNTPLAFRACSSGALTRFGIALYRIRGGDITVGQNVAAYDLHRKAR